MPNLPDRVRDAGTSWRVPARIGRAVHTEVAIVGGQAIVEAARTQAVEYVAHSALRAIEGLTGLEALALTRNPLGDARYKAIVDTAAARLAHIVAETARD
jgi:hypothetical protein